MTRRTLSFDTLRTANLARLPRFRNAKGEIAHPSGDGSNWSLNDWMVAVVGEVGEAANVLKKVRRGDMTIDEARPKLTQEFSDIIIYLDLICHQAGIDLGPAVKQTFNNKSRQVGSLIEIGDDDDWHVRYDDAPTDRD